jgi:signal transduction histidine kinase
VVIAVTDQGSGFAPEAAERAFDPFFTTKGMATHMGLGLSTVMGLVRQGGGRVEIDSAPGQGATVRVELPRVSARQLR